MTIKTYEQAQKWVDTQLAKKNKHIVQDMEITPALADYLLSIVNPDQRHINQPTVKALCSAIERDEYLNDSDLFMISKAGTFDNGSHRCHAVIKTGKSIRNHFIFNVPEEAFRNTDGNKPRSFLDQNPDLALRPSGKRGSPLSKIAHNIWRVLLSDGGYGNKAPAGIIRDICKRIRYTVDDVDALGFGTKTAWSVTPVQAAVVLHLLRTPGSVDAILDQYALLNTIPSKATLQENTNRWPILYSLQNRLSDIRNDRTLIGSKKQRQQLLLSLKGFSEKNRARDRIVLTDPEGDALVCEWGGFFREVMK